MGLTDKVNRFTQKESPCRILGWILIGPTFSVPFSVGTINVVFHNFVIFSMKHTSLSFTPWSSRTATSQLCATLSKAFLMSIQTHEMFLAFFVASSSNALSMSKLFIHPIEPLTPPLWSICMSLNLDSWPVSSTFIREVINLYVVLRQVIGLKFCGTGLSFLGNITVLPLASHDGSDFELLLIRVVIASAKGACRVLNSFIQKLVILSGPGEVQFFFFFTQLYTVFFVIVIGLLSCVGLASFSAFCTSVIQSDIKFPSWSFCQIGTQNFSKSSLVSKLVCLELFDERLLLLLLLLPLLSTNFYNKNASLVYLQYIKLYSGSWERTKDV